MRSTGLHNSARLGHCAQILALSSNAKLKELTHSFLGDSEHSGLSKRYVLRPMT